MDRNTTDHQEVELKDIVRFVFSKKLLIIGFSVLIALLTWLYNFSTPKYYNQSATFYSTILNTKELQPYLDQFSEMVNQPDDFGGELSQHMIPEAASSLTSIATQNISYDQNVLTFKVKFSVTDPQFTQNIVDGLVSFISESEYFKNKLEMKSTELNYLIEESESEIKALKAYKELVLSEHKNGTAQINYPINLNNEMLHLQESFIRYSSDLKTLTLVSGLSPISPRTSPSGPQIQKNTILSFFVSLIFGSFLAVVYKLFF